MDASSSSQPRCTYDVFLSFRGEDTRRGFTDHLYKALDQSGILTFRDDDEIPRGTKIQQELEKAIQESRLSVVVFSKDYASSRWCLDELVKITQRTKTDGRHIIIPVFYDVDPSDVRKQTGTFSEAFSKHEERFKEEMDRVEEWRSALRDVPDLAGMVLGDRYQSEFIQDLVEEVANKLDRKALYVAPYAVGVDRRVQPINMWLKDGSDDVGIAVICGMGGIGKTTVAKTAYNQNFDSFEGSSFLADVREILEQRKGLLDLQRQLLSDIQKKKAKKISSPHEGVEKIKGAVSCKRVLIVVDDVDDPDQLRAILGDQKCFHPGSKIIITTRDGHLLKGHQAFEMFEVKGLYLFESLELFSRLLHKDAINILRKSTGTETIKGLMLKEDESSSTTYISSRKRCHIEDCEGNSSRRRRLDFFSWQPINFFFKSSAPESEETGFKTKAFRKIPNLEILVLMNVKFNGDFEHFSKNLIWLCWSGFPEKSIPTKFSLTYVVPLHLKNSSLQHVWKETPPRLPRLKILNLSHSHDLKTTPNFSLLPQLERLVLKDCINLAEIDESIGDLEKLVFLDMTYCRNLMILPRSMCKLRSLQTFDLSGCSKLVQATSTYMENLGQMLMNLWQTICQRPVLSKNVGLSCFSLANLSNSLTKLSLSRCNISEISSDICFLSSLKRLDLAYNPISSLPENIDQLFMLEDLLVYGCTKLRALPKLPPNLRTLSADDCKSLKRVTNSPCFLKQMFVDFDYCEKLEQVESWFIIKPLRSIGKEMKQLLPQIGFFDFESEETERDELVRMYNFLTYTYQKLPSQALYECGIFSTFLRGDKIPESFDCHKSSDGNSVLSITLSRLNSVDHDDLNYKIRGLNICVVYGHKYNILRSRGPYLKVSNKGKGQMWVYNPMIIRVPEEDEGVLWMSHWLFEGEDLQVGDTIRVSVDGYDCILIKEFGVQILYENEHENKGMALSNLYGGGDEDVAVQPELETVHSASSIPMQNHYNNFADSVSASLSIYELLKPGRYLLCNHSVGDRHDLAISGPPYLRKYFFQHSIYDNDEEEDDEYEDESQALKLRMKRRFIDFF